MRYDLVVIGHEAAGLEAAVLAARMNRFVAVVTPHAIGADAVERLAREGIDCLEGDARFLSPRQLEIVGGRGGCLVEADRYLVACGRETDRLGCHAAGLVPDEHGRLWCDAVGRTWAEHVYAVGASVGYPVVPHVAADEQARQVVGQMFRRSSGIAEALVA